MEHIYISVVGIVFLVMLLVPNFIWTKYLPIGYDASHEKRYLVWLERIGEVSVSCLAVIVFHPLKWNIGVLISIGLMLMYEGYWIRYFRSSKTLADFYCSFLGIPLAGATLPVLAFMVLGLSQQHFLLVISTIILGIGHIGIHIYHLKEINQ